MCIEPISSGIGEAESTKVIPIYAVGAVVGGLVAIAVALIVSVVLGIVCWRRRRTSRTIYITTGKERV